MHAADPSHPDGGGVSNDAGGAPVVAVATSGGRDSIALLHATLAAAEPLGLRVAALHVHHGLMPDADRWAAALEARCDRWAAQGRPVRFDCTRLAGAPAAGDSVEAWARRGRYAALATMARAAGATLVLLAHHRRDQAETVLLQALRGAGPAGLAAMPRVVERDGLTWARPWLARDSDAIDDYVRAVGLEAVVDPSNTDPRYARSRLRTVVMPVLRQAFADVETAFAAVARHAQEGRTVLDEVALEDLQRLGAGDTLPLAAWRSLSPPRRANALRRWLAQGLGRSVPDTLVRRLVDEAVDEAPRRWPVDEGVALRSWRGRLGIVEMPGQGVGDRDGECALVDETLPAAVPSTSLSLLRCARYAPAGWAGVLDVFATDREGVSPHRLAQLLLRTRAGGERFQMRRNALPRSLKKQYQAAAVPLEDRVGPLLFDIDGHLLFVPGLGLDARAWADDGAPQWGLRWRAGAGDER